MNCKCGVGMGHLDMDPTLWYCGSCERLYDSEFDCWSDEDEEMEALNEYKGWDVGKVA